MTSERNNRVLFMEKESGGLAVLETRNQCFSKENRSVVSLATERCRNKECKVSFRFGIEHPLTNLSKATAVGPEPRKLWIIE